MTDSSGKLQGNASRFDGLSQNYNSSRPSPPTALLDLLPSIVNKDSNNTKVNVLVDIGCGTGLSTFFWKNNVRDLIVGVEPNQGMLDCAQDVMQNLHQSGNLGSCKKIEFKQAFSSDTGIASDSVDIVTCSQSLHWMEPTATFKEIHRILRKGGLFVAYDCDWPPTVLSWESEVAYRAVNKKAKELGKQRNIYKDVVKYKKTQHIQRMKDSQLFSYVKEIHVHSQEMGNADRLVNLALSQGGVSQVLRAGGTEEEILVPELRRITNETLGCEMKPWHWSYAVRYAIK